MSAEPNRTEELTAVIREIRERVRAGIPRESSASAIPRSARPDAARSRARCRRGQGGGHRQRSTRAPADSLNALVQTAKEADRPRARLARARAGGVQPRRSGLRAIDARGIRRTEPRDVATGRILPRPDLGASLGVAERSQPPPRRDARYHAQRRGRGPADARRPRSLGRVADRLGREAEPRRGLHAANHLGAELVVPAPHDAHREPLPRDHARAPRELPRSARQSRRRHPAAPVGGSRTHPNRIRSDHSRRTAHGPPATGRAGR